MGDFRRLLVYQRAVSLGDDLCLLTDGEFGARAREVSRLLNGLINRHLTTGD